MRLGGIDASQRLGPLELITQVAVEVRHPARMQVHHCDVPIVGSARETAAQHEGWGGTRRQTVSFPGGSGEEMENVTHIPEAHWCQGEERRPLGDPGSPEGVFL